MIKLSWKNGEPTIVALPKFRLENELKGRKCPISLNGISKIIRRFEEMGSVEDAQARENYATWVLSQMELNP